jgi:hypothetical protein
VKNDRPLPQRLHPSTDTLVFDARPVITGEQFAKVLAA